MPVLRAAHAQKDWTCTDENVIFWDRMTPDMNVVEKREFRNPYRSRDPYTFDED
jgi:hypothetical protein